MIKLTKPDWLIVQKQCDGCKYWSEDGCEYPQIAYAEPVDDCPCYEVKEEK